MVTVTTMQRPFSELWLCFKHIAHLLFSPFISHRELLQNADDAGATSVQIRFYTKAGAEAKDATGGEGVARPSSLEETVKSKRVPDFKTDEVRE